MELSVRRQVDQWEHLFDILDQQDAGSDSVTNLEFRFTLYKAKTRPNPMKGGVTM